MAGNVCGECGKYCPASKHVGICAYRKAIVMAVANKVFRNKAHYRVHRNSKACEQFIKS